MEDDIFTDADMADNARINLGPAYFAARRISEELMSGENASYVAEFKPVIDSCVEQIRNAAYGYIEDCIKSDLEQNLQGYIRRMVESTIEALLTGEEWAMNQYPLSKRNDGEKIRAAVAKHGGEPLLMLRIGELESEVRRLRESLKWSSR